MVERHLLKKLSFFPVDGVPRSAQRAGPKQALFSLHLVLLWPSFSLGWKELRQREAETIADADVLGTHTHTHICYHVPVL